MPRPVDNARPGAYVNVLKKVRTNGGWKLCPVVRESNGRLRDRVGVNGRTEVHSEGERYSGSSATLRYYKGHIALSDACDVPILLHLRNARAICFDQLCDLLSLEIITERPRSLRWRLARLEEPGLVTRLQGQTHLRTPVFGITQQGLIFLESRGHYWVSLPSATEAILHPSQVSHALEMVSIRVAFAKAGVLHSWKADLEIASKNLVLEDGAAKDFDAVAGIEGKSRTIGTEYDAEPKSCRQAPLN